MSDPSSPSSSVLVKVQMPRDLGSGFQTLKVEAENSSIADLKRQVLEKARTKRVSISLPAGSLPTAPTPVPALPQSTVDEYGLTLLDESAEGSKAAPAFLADERPLKDLRRQFANVAVWKLALVAKPKQEQGVTQGWLKKKASSTRLGGAWQKRFFRLTTKQLAYFSNEEAANDPKGAPKGSFPVSGFHEAITVAAKSPTAASSSSAAAPTSPSPSPASPANGAAAAGAPAVPPRGRVARQASVLNTNLDSTRVRLGPWGSFVFILEFPGRALELQAANKEDFQRWLNALFGAQYMNNLAVRHEEEEKVQPPPPAKAPAAASANQNQRASIVASTLPLSGQHDAAIPIESRLNNNGSREHSLSARDVLKGDRSMFDGETGNTGAIPRDDVDSEDSMSEAWDAREDWALHALHGPPAAGANVIDPIRRDSHSGAGEHALNSFMPSASVTPASSVHRPDNADNNPAEQVVFASEPIPIESSEDEEEEAPPPTAPFPSAASPVSPAAPSPIPIEESSTPVVAAVVEEPVAAPTPAAEPQAIAVSTPAAVPAPVTTAAATSPVATPPTPTGSSSGGMFAGGFGAAGAAGVGHRSSLIGSTSIAAAALDSTPASPTRKESFSGGLSPMASVGRRPSIDQSAPIMPPAGAELNFSPTLQRRLSHSGLSPLLPPTPAEPAPVPSDAEIAATQQRLQREKDEAEAAQQRAAAAAAEKAAAEQAAAAAAAEKAASEQRAAAEKAAEEKAAAEKAEADRIAAEAATAAAAAAATAAATAAVPAVPAIPIEPEESKEDAAAEAQRLERAAAHERNLANIRRFLEEEAAAELQAKGGVVVQEEEVRKRAESAAAKPEEDAPPPAAPFPASAAPVSPSNGIAAAPLAQTLSPEDASHLEQHRQTIAVKSQSELVDLSTNQQKEILELKRQLKLLQDKQGQQVR